MHETPPDEARHGAGFAGMLGCLEGFMRIERDDSKLPIDEQIGKLKKKIKFLIIFSCIWSVFVIALSVILIIFTSEWELGVGFLVLLPVSIILGGVLQIKDCIDKIRKLQERTQKVD